MTRFSLKAAAAGIALVGMAAAAPAWSAPGGWEFEASPYIWLAGVDGSFRAGPPILPSANVDWSAGDVLSHLSVGAMGALEGRKDKWGFWLDAIYVNLSGGGVRPGGRFSSVDGEIKEQIYTFAGTYRVVDGPTKLDAVGGLRYVDISADITAFPRAGGIRSSSPGASWWDPFIGARVLYPIADKWTLVGYGDIGGFDAGSNFAWQAIAGVNYEISKTLSAKVGFRILDMDYSDDTFGYNAYMAGFYAGVGIRF
jgi:opacity protein-like surface antigen